jgi:ATP-dependent Lon protease
MSRVDRLPLFPLERVLYPEERLPLHIFEPRYKLMIRRCLETGIPFGIVMMKDDDLRRVGCTATVDRVLNEYDDGRMDILVSGQNRFKVVELFDDQPYLSADVELFDDTVDVVPSDLKERAITQHMKLLELAGKVMRPTMYQSTRQVSFVLARNAGLSVEQKQDLLENLSEHARISYLVDYFEALIPQVESAEGVRRKIRSNGHFPDFPDQSAS